MKYPCPLILLLAVILSSCGKSQFRPDNGDLLFCVAESSSSMSSAIVESTKTTDSLQYDHVALYAEIDGAASVIEASPSRGVVIVSLDDFLKNAALANGAPGVVVMRLPLGAAAIDSAVNRAISQVGRPYDWSYLPDNGKTYCSELIYESFVNVFDAKPMNFADSTGAIPQFWTDLFARAGETIPQGVPGTNPNDMARHHSLRLIYRYFQP